ncbi:MAG: hypothetical protein JXX28_19755 [Deltaproteobacteria bacterium]|nr:hypothetical protein [Deltaproteobacteria bacterium]
MTLEWVGSDGPCVLIPQDASPAWGGIWVDGPGPRADATTLPDGRVVWEDVGQGGTSDYQRACDALDDEPPGLVGRVGAALVLDSTGLQVAWWPTARGGWVVIWEYAESEEEAEAALRGAAPGEAAPAGRWSLPEGGALLMPATELPGDEDAEGIAVPLPAGTYEVFAGELAPDAFTMLRLVRLERVAG